MIYAHPFYVGVHNVGERNELTNKAILEALTDVSNLHGLTIGQSMKDRERSHLSWMVANWKLKVIKRPKVCETFIARTWAQKYSKAHAFRDYDLLDETGDVCALATSKWILTSTETGSLLRLSPEIMEPFRPEPDRVNFPDFTFMRPERMTFPAQRKAFVKVNRYMIDYNGHVHNPAYLDLAAEVMPNDLWRKHFNQLEVDYRKEIRLGETVQLVYGEADGTHYVQLKSEDGSILHAVVAFSEPMK